MSKHESADHWRSIAEELGAEVPADLGSAEPPASEEASTKPQDTPRSEPVPPRRQEPPRAARPPKARPNWAAVAEQLGLAPTETLPAQEPKTDAVPSRPTTDRPAAPAESRDWLDQDVRLEAATEAEPAGQPTDVSGRSEESDECRSRKRRKRRRRSRQPRAAEDVSESPRESGDSLVTGDTEEAMPPDVVVSEGEAGAPTSTTDEISRRGRRDRGRRRRRSGERRAREDATEPVAADEPPRETEPESAASEEEATAEEYEPGGESSGKEGESFHGGIPSWAEAVGIVITANLEARTRRGATEPSSRGRGGRGRKDRSAPKQSKPN